VSIPDLRDAADRAPTSAADLRGADETVGAQAERTELAWVRTALAAGGLAALATRLIGADHAMAALAIGAVIALPGLVASWWRIAALRRHAEPPPPRVAAVSLLAATVVAVDVLVLALLVL
jgi:uncharacterized membrane protein YidH (DUF202 family)